MRSASFLAASSALLLAVAACNPDPTPPGTPTPDVVADGITDTPGADASPDVPGPPHISAHPSGTHLPAEPQRDGDPAAGWDAILGAKYVNCGVPGRLYDIAVELGAGFGGDPAPGREGDLPYFVSRFDTTQGEEVVGPNCLTCHAGYINGELVVGLGGTDIDYAEMGGMITQLSPSMIEQISAIANLTPGERAELDRFAERFMTVLPYIEVEVAGVNPADNLAAILFAHRDPQTLEWHDEPLIEPPPNIVVPIDTPPWWRMAKKSTMFYVAAGRGDHARIMMTASTLCVDSVPAAEAIDATMPDVAAFIRSIEPPLWPWGVDPSMVEQGREVFEATCAGCHGTYRDDVGHTYPNLVIPIDEIGTDPVLALGASQFVGRFLDWYAASFYGDNATLDPQEGYVPPPLDGIWATAPYLHNGSVPTLAALLDSTTRPRYWKRTFNSSDYDQEAVGWIHTVEETGHVGNPTVDKWTYDTDKLGYSRSGHTYGDALTPEGRASLIEYLKTL